VPQTRLKPSGRVGRVLYNCTSRHGCQPGRRFCRRGNAHSPYYSLWTAKSRGEAVRECGLYTVLLCSSIWPADSDVPTRISRVQLRLSDEIRSCESTGKMSM